VNHAQLVALGRSLRVAGEHGQRLDDADTVFNVEEIRQDLERSLALVNDAISSPKPTTRCPEHPAGPVDPDAFDGCLLCETRRRAGLRTPRARQGDIPSPASDDEDAPLRVQSQYSIRSDQPEPRKRWIPEMWNGQAWQMCGTPRQSEQEAHRYLEGLCHSPGAASAYRLVYAYTDHQVLRVWGRPLASPPPSAAL
jgi:hypothetical protein